MNTKNNKNSIILITIIMAVVATIFFLVVKITLLFITAYIFAIMGIASFCAGNLYMISSPKSYPWFAAFPMKIWQYLIIELSFSSVVVLLENLFDISLPVKWFVLLHIILSAFFLITLILIKSGKEIIAKREQEVKKKVTTIRFMQADLDLVIQKFPEFSDNLKKVAESLRYSDPMSHPSLAFYDESIMNRIVAMTEFDKEEATNIPDKCEELLRKIADRNNRVKLLK